MTEQYTGWRIGTGFLTGNLFATTEGVDVDTSITSYQEQVLEALQQEYPGAEVTVSYQHAEGALPRTLRTWVSAPVGVGVDEDAMAEEIDGIASRVWEQHDWLIYLDEDAVVGQ